MTNENISTNLAESSYEGWVAWVDGNPIFEHIEDAPGMLTAIVAMPRRVEDRNTTSWKKLDTRRIERFELYFARAYVPDQPMIRIDREPGYPHLRFIQMKLGGIVWGAGVRPGRLGINGYRVGYWDDRRMECRIWEALRDGSLTELNKVKNPLLPRPLGHGYSPDVLGAGYSPTSLI